MNAPAGERLLAVRGVGKRYGEREALRGVSFQAHAGELVAVTGPNGAGKTTLLSILAGLQAPSSGEVSLPASRVGWVPQRPATYSKLSVAENLELFARLEGVSDVGGSVRAMLDQTGLRERASERLDRLSGGGRQRVNIALGLLADPPVLVLDEPSSSLDPRQRERLWRFIGGLAAQGRCVVFSTHNVSEVERYASQVVVLADGELLFSGAPASLAQEVAGAYTLDTGARAADTDIEGASAGATDATPRTAGADFEAAFVEFLRTRGH